MKTTHISPALHFYDFLHSSTEEKFVKGIEEKKGKLVEK
jgi:hypothetical protein